MCKYILEAIVFVAGAVVMIFELVGSRVLAPYLGTSIVIWTSLIGVILGSLSLGYYLGGRLSDKKPEHKTFSLILFISAVLIGITALLQVNILNWLETVIKNLQWRGLAASLILFAPGSVFLGMVSPYAVRLKIKAVESSGMTVGNLYAISTVGSICGTFAAGFLLIPFFGTNQLLYFLAAVMLAASLIANFKYLIKAKISVFILILAISTTTNWAGNMNGIIDIDTQYNRVLIYDILESGSGRTLKILRFDPHGIQGGMYVDQPEELVFEYTKFYRLIDHFSNNPTRGLMIGGGAYSYPFDFLSKHPQASMDVVEIDPKITEMAKQYFNLRDNPRLKIVSEDGRVYLNRAEKSYDAVFVDVFNSHISIPYHLTTKEAVSRAYDLLENDGVAMVNLISSLEGAKSRFFRAEYATFKSVFPQVYIFPVKDRDNPERLQNIMLVALKSDKLPELKSDNQELDGYLENLWTREIKTDLPILTDNYAPVDYYGLSLL